MMNRITLHNDGSIAEDRKVAARGALRVLGCRIDLETGYTLRSFFRMLERHALLAELNAFAPDCLQRYRECPPARCTCDAVDHLEFYKTVEMIGYPGEPRLEIYNTLSGVRGAEAREIKALHLASLLDVPLKLGLLKHKVFGDKVDIFEFETVFNFFEFVDGIVWELSFQGTPKECAI
jgi:hypothetical protein